MLVKRYKGQVVKRMRRAPGGILLTLLSNQAGQRGKQLLVSQADWEKFGSESHEKRVSLADLRRRQAE
jgi:hypothetical protein